MYKTKLKSEKGVRYTDEDIREIENLANKGYTDTEIAKITGVGLQKCWETTTKYWVKKMEEKHINVEEEIKKAESFSDTKPIVLNLPNDKSFVVLKCKHCSTIRDIKDKTCKHC